MVVVGLLMISNIKYYSFKQMDRKRVPFVVMLPVVLILQQSLIIFQWVF